MEAKKLGLIDQIENGMKFYVKELIERNRNEDWFKNPVFSSMRIKANMDQSIEDYKESLTRRRVELELTLEEIEIITKEAYSRVYNELFEK